MSRVEKVLGAATCWLTRLATTRWLAIRSLATRPILRVADGRATLEVARQINDEDPAHQLISRVHRLADDMSVLARDIEAAGPDRLGLMTCSILHAVSGSLAAGDATLLADTQKAMVAVGHEFIARRRAERDFVDERVN